MTLKSVESMHIPRFVIFFTCLFFFMGYYDLHQWSLSSIIIWLIKHKSCFKKQIITLLITLDQLLFFSSLLSAWQNHNTAKYQQLKTCEVCVPDHRQEVLRSWGLHWHSNTCKGLSYHTITLSKLSYNFFCERGQALLIFSHELILEKYEG